MNTSGMPLHKMPVGAKARVKELPSKDGIRGRLQDIGLIEGTVVECLQKSPAGDPIAYLIRGAVIALRSEDSSLIIVESGDGYGICY